MSSIKVVGVNDRLILIARMFSLILLGNLVSKDTLSCTFVTTYIYIDTLQGLLGLNLLEWPSRLTRCHHFHLKVTALIVCLYLHLCATTASKEGTSFKNKFLNTMLLS